MTLKNILRMPAKRVTGWIETSVPGFYALTNEDYDWAGIVPKSDDKRYLPVAWNTYHQALLWGGDYAGVEDDFLASANVQLTPDNYFAKPRTVLRLPRLVLVYAQAYSTIIDAIAPILTELNEKNVAVMYLVSNFAQNNLPPLAGVGYLPNYDAEEIVDTPPGGGAGTTVHPLVTPTDWTAGEVLYLCESFWASGGTPVGLVDPPGDPFVPFTDCNDNTIALIQAGYSRYARYGLHITTTNQWDATDPGYNEEASIIAETDRIITALTDYGTTLDYISHGYLGAGYATAVEDSFRNKIVEFFDL